MEENEPLSGTELVDQITELALAKKAVDPVTIDLREKSAAADFFVICNGENAVHNRAIFDGVALGLKSRGMPPFHSEGIEEGRWLLLDYSDVVVHILLPDLREYYALERLWSEEHTRTPRSDAKDSFHD